jgi:hypothetical protein
MSQQVDGEEPMPPGQLRARTHDPELHDAIRAADIIFGANPRTDEKSGPYYGIAQIKRIARRDASEMSRWLTLPIDPATDDVEVACALIQTIKGARCYGAFSETAE